MKIRGKGKFLPMAVAFVLLLFMGTGCAGGKEGKVIRNDKKGIPDKVLYEAVLDFGDANEDGILTVEEAATMEDLVVGIAELRGVTGLKGLEYCTGLKNLILENLAITDLSALSGLKSLDYLALNQNKITDISPLAGLTNLSRLHLKDNAITNVDKLAELTGLESLVLSGNKIENGDALAKLTGLEGLYLEDNEITDIRFLSELTNLEELCLGGNEIKDVQALSGLTGLECLELDNNAITEVDALSKLVNLSNLGNPVTNTGGIPEYVEYEEEVVVRYLSEKDKASLMEKFALSEYNGKVICTGDSFAWGRKYSPYDDGHGESYTIGRNEAGELVLGETAYAETAYASESMQTFGGPEEGFYVVLENGNCWFIYSGDVSKSGLEFMDIEEYATRIEPFAKTAESGE